jgi:hypothetical protein
MSQALCPVCQLEVDLSVSGLRLECGHIFHVRCAVGYLSRNYAYCIACHPGESIPEEIKEFPLNFGDDVRLEAIYERRKLAMYNYLKCSPSSEKNKSIKSKDIAAYLRLKEKAIVSGEEQPKQEGNLFRTLTSLISKAFDPSGELGETQEDNIYTDDDPILLIYNGTPAWELGRKYNVDATTLGRRGIKLTTLFEYDYNFEDLIILETTWKDALRMGMHIELLKEYKEQLPITKMVEYWGITWRDIFVDVCKRKMSLLAKVGLTVEEFKLLGLNNVNDLLVAGLRGYHLPKFTLKMEDWVSLGLTFDHLSKEFRMDPVYITEKLGWIKTEDDLDDFKRLFGHSPTELLEEETDRLQKEVAYRFD